MTDNNLVPLNSNRKTCATPAVRGHNQQTSVLTSGMHRGKGDHQESIPTVQTARKDDDLT
jgi:hypothetical protein